jgi:hypothetical protein
MSHDPEFDPRWEWVNISSWDDLAHNRPQYVKGRCNHLVIVPVTDTDGVEVAQLCTICDAQFPPSREP